MEGQLTGGPYDLLDPFYLLLPFVLESLFDSVHRPFNRVDAYGAFFTRLLHAREDFRTVERFPSSVFLDHKGKDLFDALVGGESLSTAQALPPPADDLALPGRPAVHNPVAILMTERATHSGPLPRRHIEMRGTRGE